MSRRLALARKPILTFHSEAAHINLPPSGLQSGHACRNKHCAVSQCAVCIRSRFIGLQSPARPSFDTWLCGWQPNAVTMVQYENIRQTWNYHIRRSLIVEFICSVRYWVCEFGRRTPPCMITSPSSERRNEQDRKALYSFESFAGPRETGVNLTATTFSSCRLYILNDRHFGGVFGRGPQYQNNLGNNTGKPQALDKKI
jgi:hypothetical protein